MANTVYFVLVVVEVLMIEHGDAPLFVFINSLGFKQQIHFNVFNLEQTSSNRRHKKDI